MEAIVNWAMQSFTESSQAFHACVVMLHDFVRMQMDSLPFEELQKVERDGAGLDWIEIQRQLRRELYNRSWAIPSREPIEVLDILTPSSERRRLLEKERAVEAARQREEKMLSIYDPFRTPRRFVLGDTQPFLFRVQCQVYIFPSDLHPGDAAQMQDAVAHYLCDMVFNGLVGKRIETLGICDECEKMFVQRRKVRRMFCSSRCRWLDAARRNYEARTAAKGTKKAKPTKRTSRRSESLVPPSSRAGMEKAIPKWAM